MKYRLLMLSFISFIFFNGLEGRNQDSLLTSKNEELENRNAVLKERLDSMENLRIEDLIRSYQETNTKLNSQVSYISMIATIFGVLIALGGIWIAFESFKSSRERSAAIKTLAEAKEYVENKKADFNKNLSDKTNAVEAEYQNLISLIKGQLLKDTNDELDKVKNIVAQKSEEIENFSVNSYASDKMKSIEQKIDMIESISIPDDPEVLLSKAKLLSGKKMHEDSIKLLKKLILIDDKNIGAYWQLGWEYLTLEKNSEAIEFYSKYIELNTGSSSSFNNRGIAYERSDRPIDALKDFESAIKLDPDEKIYIRNEIRIYKKQNSIEMALKKNAEAIIKFPKDLEFRNWLIQILIERNEIEKVVEAFDQSILDIPEESNNFNLKKADFLIKNNKVKEAIPILHGLLEGNFKPDESGLLLSKAFIMLNENKNAQEVLDKILNLNPNNPDAIVQKTNILLAINEIKQAVDFVNKAVEKSSNEMFIEKLAKCFSDIGHLKEAQNLYSQAEKIIKSKLSDAKHGDLLNYFEVLVLLERYKEAQDFIKIYERAIPPERSCVVEFIKCSLVILNGTQKVSKPRMLEFVKFTPPKSEFGWNYSDILNIIKIRFPGKTFEAYNAVADFLKGKISAENFNKNIENIFA